MRREQRSMSPRGSIAAPVECLRNTVAHALPAGCRRRPNHTAGEWGRRPEGHVDPPVSTPPGRLQRAGGTLATPRRHRAGTVLAAPAPPAPAVARRHGSRRSGG